MKQFEQMLILTKNDDSIDESIVYLELRKKK